MAFLGMDVELAKGEHSKLTSEIANLRNAKDQITQLVARVVPEIWKGTDAQNFEQSWNGHRGTLDSLLNEMESFAKDFMGDITEQENVSRS